MKAIVQHKYGSPDDVLEFKDIDKPVAKNNEALVRVRAASVHPDVLHIVKGLPYVFRLIPGVGLRKPLNGVPGIDMAGHVETVGENVTQVQPGDEVFGETISGHQFHNCGAFAEYVAVSEDALVLKPVNLTFEQAAAVPTSGFIALVSVRDHGQVQPGQKVLINGAGGGVGTFAVQLAKAYGADVTAVDSTGKLEMIRSIGADQVIDYTQEDFTRSSKRYDLIVDIAAKHSLTACRRALTRNGTCVLIGLPGGRWIGSLGSIFKLRVLSQFVSQGMRPLIQLGRKEDLATLKELIEAGKVTPVIDRTYPLSEVPEAIRYIEEGYVQGKVVITV